MSDKAQVFEDVNIRVYLADGKGNNRVGGGDANLFSLVFYGGPSTTPTVRSLNFRLGASSCMSGLKR